MLHTTTTLMKTPSFTTIITQYENATPSTPASHHHHPGRRRRGRMQYTRSWNALQVLQSLSSMKKKKPKGQIPQRTGPSYFSLLDSNHHHQPHSPTLLQQRFTVFTAHNIIHLLLNCIHPSSFLELRGLTTTIRSSYSSFYYMKTHPTFFTSWWILV